MTLPDTYLVDIQGTRSALFTHVAKYEAYRAEVMRRARAGDEKAKRILWVRWKMRYVG